MNPAPAAKAMSSRGISRSGFSSARVDELARGASTGPGAGFPDGGAGATGATFGGAGDGAAADK